jgi:diguanylate cyclase (GGDEF)-like protein/PAS domain S-box-containing protein
MHMNESSTSLAVVAFGALRTPVWIYDPQTWRMCWANKAALRLWNIQTVDDLCQGSSEEDVESTRMRLSHHLEQFHQGQTIQEQWIFHSQGHPVLLDCYCSSISIGDGRSGILVEGSFDRPPAEEQGLFIAGPIVVFKWQPVAGWIVDYVSPNVYEQLGYLPQAFTQKSLSYADLIHPDDLTRVEQEVQHYTRSGVAFFEQEYRLQRADGEYCWLYDFTTVLRGANGEVLHYLGYVQDITERKQIEAELRQSEALWQYALEASGEGVWDWNIQTNEIFFSHRWKEILGFGMHDFENSMAAWDSLIHPDDRQRVYAAIDLHLQGKTDQYVSEYRIRCKDGTYKWNTDRGRVVQWTAEGLPQRMIGTNIDITERKQIEEALHESKEILQAIFDHIPIMLVFFNAQGQVELINHELIRALGWSLADWQQRDPLLHSQPDSAYRQQILAHIQVATGQWRDFKARNKQGQVLDTSWTKIRITDGGEIGIGQDITERKRIEERLRQRAKRDRLTSVVTQRIRKSLDLEEILNVTVSEIRQVLQTDRVLVYRFEPDASGVVVAESVGEGWISLMGRRINKNLMLSYPKFYTHGRIQNTADIYDAELPEEYVEILSQFQVRATLVLPILRGESLWGLLMVQHCLQPRIWQSTEVELLSQLSNQVMIAIQQSELYQQLQQANRELQHLATRDKLTQLANRHYFDDYLHQEWNRLLQERSPLAIILCDIDYFKRYNDTYGHLAGDECLAKVAQAIGRAVKRPADLVARYGGEEFAIILPDTNHAGAVRVAQSIRAEIAALEIPHIASSVQPWITVSLGIASEYPTAAMSPQRIISKADRALYRAKDQGRNSYC